MKTQTENTDSSTEKLLLSDVSGSFTLDDMRKAFEGGRDSVEAELKYENFGDRDAYASKKIIKSFKTFIHENYS
jgi:hypothetical protein